MPDYGSFSSMPPQQGIVCSLFATLKLKRSKPGKRLIVKLTNSSVHIFVDKQNAVYSSRDESQGFFWSVETDHVRHP